MFAHLDELEHPRRRRRRLGKDWREEKRGGNEERESGMHVIFIFPLPPGWAGTEVGTAAATFTCEHRRGRLSKSCPVHEPISTERFSMSFGGAPPPRGAAQGPKISSGTQKL